MKRISFILISLLFTHNINSQSGWFWQNPLPQGNDINCVEFINPSIAYAVTLGGTFLKSTDKGDTWAIKVINDTLYFYSLSFADSLNGFIGSTDGFI